MSKQALDAFRTKLSQDASLREELASSLGAAAGKPRASTEELATFARARGFEFTAKDLSEHVELGDDELDQVAGGASDYLLKVDGIKGETRDRGHKDWIELLSFNRGV